MSRKFLDADHPMLRPLWVRLVILALCFGWAAFEFVGGSPLWGMVFGALGAYAAWAFFLAAPDKPDGQE